RYGVVRQFYYELPHFTVTTAFPRAHRTSGTAAGAPGRQSSLIRPKPEPIGERSGRDHLVMPACALDPDEIARLQPRAVFACSSSLTERAPSRRSSPPL